VLDALWFCGCPAHHSGLTGSMPARRHACCVCTNFHTRSSSLSFKPLSMSPSTHPWNSCLISAGST
jgi:hypothetical protein